LRRTRVATGRRPPTAIARKASAAPSRECESMPRAPAQTNAQAAGSPEFRAFRDCRRWREDARATTKAGLDQGRYQGWVRLLHAFSGHLGSLAP
jgi:hypothetical protein